MFEWGHAEVIKLFHDRQHAVHEAKNADLVDSLGIRAPKSSGLIEYEGRFGIIYERIQGSSLLRQFEPTKESFVRNAKILAQVHFGLHRIKVAYPPNLKAELTHKVQRSAHLSERQKQIVTDKIRVLQDGQDLCHYDLHPDNILMSPDGPVVIDWMNVLVGNRLADVARTSMMLQSHAVPPDAPSWLVERELRLLYHQHYISEYVHLSGVHTDDVEQWMLPTLAVRIDELAHGEQEEIIKLLEEALQE